MTGDWEHGFFSLSPIGAYNVGSIAIDFDESLKTNKRGEKAGGHFTQKDVDSVEFKKGDQMGFFHLGSSVVLLFEGPAAYFPVKVGDHVKVGDILNFCLNRF